MIQRVVLTNSPRAVRGGLSFIFYAPVQLGCCIVMQCSVPKPSTKSRE